MAKIYHGCITKNADGTNKLIGPGEKSLISTDKCFWKEPEDIKSSGVKTRSQTINQPAVIITLKIRSVGKHSLKFSNPTN